MERIYGLQTGLLNDCSRIRQQGDFPGAFNGHGQDTLMFGTVARDPPRNNFTPFSGEKSK
jgi:hypothetical protein